MKRREFTSTAVLGAALGAPVWALAQAGGGLVAGRDFQLVDPRAPVDAPVGKVEVVEFFWYSCPHCNAFEPQLAAWLKKLPKDVAFKRVPVAFRDDFVPQQRLYYALEAMGLVDKLHAKVFEAIHVQRQRLARAEDIGPWIASQGVNEGQFMEQYNSFMVNAKARRATQLQDAYRIDGVPALGIAGRFYTDGVLAKSMERALQVTEVLVAEVRAGR
ncbi:thiol:disulfide interchange protein DsbA/DsbL [Curvibacter sp. APW13]|uniref:thiol:disulfide interchange protein DsbA/DsbL n=1 Tax=Curvibacter sp. APW13 TaxID=3077236 RepID=UPI0028DEE5AF|nr:thiol:disulfide interchange protein DsbA/DsbL [Curvibacter sp. APW13]MDT8990835.1 thiol:disulfide interchange protein DsbA/DsbL [Curvibacter sp. APW13]